MKDMREKKTVQQLPRDWSLGNHEKYAVTESIAGLTSNNPIAGGGEVISEGQV